VSACGDAHDLKLDAFRYASFDPADLAHLPYEEDTVELLDQHDDAAAISALETETDDSLTSASYVDPRLDTDGDTRLKNGQATNSKPGVGKLLLSSNNKYLCTATKIAAKRIVTAAHCIPDGVGLAFKLDGRTRKLKECWRRGGVDTVVCSLASTMPGTNHQLGSSINWNENGDYYSFRNGKEWAAADLERYKSCNNQEPYFPPHEKFVQFSFRKNNVDSERGDSGGPFFQDGKVVAVLTGSCDGDQNIASRTFW
jgi:hypothetical protein